MPRTRGRSTWRRSEEEAEEEEQRKAEETESDEEEDREENTEEVDATLVLARGDKPKSSTVTEKLEQLGKLHILVCLHRHNKIRTP